MYVNIIIRGFNHQGPVMVNITIIVTWVKVAKPSKSTKSAVGLVIRIEQSEMVVITHIHMAFTSQDVCIILQDLCYRLHLANTV